MVQSFIYTFILLISNQVLAIDTVPTGFRLTNSGAASIDAHGTCYMVTNSSGRDHFVATKTSAEWNSFSSNLPTGFALSSCASPLPTNLSLTHTNNNRSMTISWTGGTSAGTCNLQYLRDGSTWTNFSTGHNCDSTASFTAYFPTTNYWTNNFNGTGVQVRVVRASDSSPYGTFPQTAKCSNIGDSYSPTPDIDENCNGMWDDSYPQYTNTTYGGCPSGQQCLQNNNYYSDPGYTTPSTTCSGYPVATSGPYCGAGGGCWDGFSGTTTGSGCSYTESTYSYTIYR